MRQPKPHHTPLHTHSSPGPLLVHRLPLCLLPATAHCRRLLLSPLARCRHLADALYSRVACCARNPKDPTPTQPTLSQHIRASVTSPPMCIGLGTQGKGNAAENGLVGMHKSRLAWPLPLLHAPQCAHDAEVCADRQHYPHPASNPAAHCLACCCQAYEQVQARCIHRPTTHTASRQPWG